MAVTHSTFTGNHERRQPVSTTKYVFIQWVGWWHHFQYHQGNVIEEIEGRGFKHVGNVGSEAADHQLQGQPIFEGVLGPTFKATDGAPEIYYEDADNWKNADNW